MAAVFSFVIGILAVILAFGFIIFIHEMGHFLTARAVDIRCPQFAIGFGPSLFSFRWKGTNFAVRGFPVGGYVMMTGEEPGENHGDPWSASVHHYLGECSFPAKPQALVETLEKIPEEERNAAWQDVYDQVKFARCEEFSTLKMVEGNFHDRPILSRILVISGGVLMNFAATFLLLWFLGPMVGLGAFFRDWSPVLSQVFPDTPAAAAGLAPRDRLLKVDGQDVETYLDAMHGIGKFMGADTEIVWENEAKEEKKATLRPRLAVGFEYYTATDEGGLQLVASSKNAELENLKVLSPDREGLLELLEGKTGKDEATYQVQLEGQEKPTEFELPKKFAGPRGIIGIKFGVSEIQFEREFTGVVASVKDVSPASLVGLKPGDEIVSVGGLSLYGNTGLIYGSKIPDALRISSGLASNDEIELLVVRDGEAETVALPKKSEAYSLETLGITLKPVGGKQLAMAPPEMIGMFLAQPYHILRVWLNKEYTTSEIVENLQGPIGIMSMLYSLADNGLMQFLYFVALLNAAIGAFNLLPFPALDGSRLVFLAIEGLRGKAVDPDKEAKIHMAGLLILLSFVVVVTFGDIRRLISAQIFVL